MTIYDLRHRHRIVVPSAEVFSPCPEAATNSPTYVPEHPFTMSPIQIEIAG